MPPAPPCPSPAVSLREARPEDAPFLYRVYAGTRWEELSVLPWTDEQKQVFLRQQFEAQDRHYREVYPAAQYSVIVCGADEIGRLYVARQPEEVRVIDLALLPSWRGRGIGGALLRELLSEAAARRQPVTLHVERNNPALRLYRRLGFQLVTASGLHQLMRWTPPCGG